MFFSSFVLFLLTSFIIITRTTTTQTIEQHLFWYCTECAFCLCVELSWAECACIFSHQLFTCFQFSCWCMVCWCIFCVLCFLFLLGDLNISIVAAVNLVGNIVSTLQYRLWYFLYFNLTLFQCVCVCVWYSVRVYISLSKSFLPKK